MPTVGLLATSLLAPADFNNKGWWQVLSSPSKLTWDNYDSVLHNSDITSALWTTVQIALGGTVVPIIIAALAAYAFAWLEFPGRDWLFILVIALLVVPLQMALIPIFSLYNHLHLFDTVFGLVLFHTAFALPFAIFLLRNFFLGIPKDVFESARIDGASEIRIFLRLVLPLGLPAIASLAIFQFLWTWNDLLVALVYGSQDPADHRGDLLEPAAVRLEHRPDRAGVVPVAGHPAGRVPRVPALLRAGPPGRIRQVGWPCHDRSPPPGRRHRRRRARRSGDLRHAGARRRRARAHRGLRRRARPGRPLADSGRRRSASASCAPRATATASRPRFPGLAFRAAVRERRAGPLWDSWRDRFHPTVDDFLADAERARLRTGWDERLVRSRVERVQAVDGGFALDGQGPFAHVLLALGHPGLHVPGELRGDPRVVHAYEPHEYAAEVTVVGAGMAAATEWLNALAAGSSVVSVRRREAVRRPLNVPRPLFTRRGLRPFHALTPAERAARLKALLAPSYPPGATFDEPLAAAEREGRFRVAEQVNGSPQVICATGFRKGFAEEPLLAQAGRRARPRDRGPLARPARRLHGARPDRPPPHAGRRRRARPVGLPRRRHAGRRQVRRARPPAAGGRMSYTLRGRLETRVAASLLPLLVSCILTIALDAWWPVELAALMLAIGLALDTEYDRLLPYQPGWYALPLGLLELGLVLGAARLLHVMAPFWDGLAFYAAAWLAATLVSQALLPLVRLSFADDGGELGLAGPTLAAGAATVLAGAAGLAFTTQRPTLHLTRGVHQGPLVIDRAEDVVGEPGAVVRGGIVIRASHVTIRHVTVVGGTNGITVQGARHVTLSDVRVSGFAQDGIHVRQSQVMVMDCSVTARRGHLHPGHRPLLHRPARAR